MIASFVQKPKISLVGRGRLFFPYLWKGVVVVVVVVDVVVVVVV